MSTSTEQQTEKRQREECRLLTEIETLLLRSDNELQETYDRFCRRHGMENRIKAYTAAGN